MAVELRTVGLIHEPDYLKLSEYNDGRFQVTCWSGAHGETAVFDEAFATREEAERAFDRCLLLYL